MALHVNQPPTLEYGLDGKSVHLTFYGADACIAIVFRSSDHFDSAMEDIDRQRRLLNAERVA